MTKATFTCPTCNKVVRDLKAHTSRVHKPEALGASPAAVPAGNQTLEIVAPKRKVDVSDYHCVDCGKPVTKGQEQCACGAVLDWRNV